MDTDSLFNKASQDAENDIDRAELEAYVQKRLKEETEKRGSQAVIRVQSLRILGDLLIVFVLGLFIVSPFVQMILRAINGVEEQPLTVYSGYVRYYQQTIYNTHLIARFTAALVLGWLILYSIVRKRKGGSANEKLSIKSLLSNLLPMIILLLFASGIALVTIIRGPNEYDLTGHPYMFESVYSYISYPLVFFFCGMMLPKENYRRILLYALLFTSLPVNILALVNEWFANITLFNGAGVCAVFHNSNHYGYYLAITIITAALLSVYEKTMWLKAFSIFCGIIATIILILNNTLGAYLAVLFVFILFIIYCFCVAKRKKVQSLIVMGGFLLITLVMNFHNSTTVSSFVALSEDLGSVIADPLESDAAGSYRWVLWKGTVEHLVESPWTGFGVEGLLNTYGVGTPHNEFLQYAAFFGIPVSLLYIAGCSTVLLRVFKSSKTMDKTTMICFFVCIGYLASSFFGVAIYYTTPFIYVFLGLTYAEYLHKKSEMLDPNNG